MVEGISPERLAALYEAGKLLNSSLDLDHVLNLTTDSLIQLTGAERGFLMLVDETTGELAFQVARNLNRETIEAASFQVSRSIVQRAKGEGKPFLIADALADPRYSAFFSVGALRLRSIMCAPIQAKGRTIGVAYVENRLQASLFTDSELEFLAAFANLAGIAIENARLYKNVKGMQEFQDHILGSVGSGILTLNSGGKITSFNRAAEAIFGLPAAEALTKPYPEVLGNGLSRRLLGSLTRIGLGEENFVQREVDCSLTRRGEVSLRLSLSPLQGGAGEPLGTVLTVEDLTEKKQLEEARRREEAEKKKLRDIFGRYVAPSIVDNILRYPDQISLGGDKQEVTVLFADIKGFTSFAEEKRPEEVVVLLNQYFSLAAAAVFRSEGTLDKFMGDALLAVFNAPLPQADHPLAAIKAALAIRDAVEQHCQTTGSPLRFALGVNTGEAIVGNIGTQELMNYTVIGDAVNVAQRLQATAQAGEVLISQAVYERTADRVKAEVLAPMQVKGRAALVQAYRVLGLKNPA